MSKDKTALNFARFVTSILIILTVLVFGFWFYQSCNQKRASEEELQQTYGYMERENWYQYPSVALIQARLIQLANRGCEVSFKSCLHPGSAQFHIFGVMDRNRIPFGASGLMPQDKFDQLVGMATERIASQKLAYLKAQGGVRFPSDLDLLGDVCWQVYKHKRSLLGYNPTDEELKQLLPPSITKVVGCEWKDD